ncbi:TRAP transporter small permease [Roseomonas sp. CCTCC AB2023176]|uniref:TRAP transporter small permease n=1 Tax=Roseomonas sp. CCTCC AB2023176 TaxID=3342640 RepID=UPI0035DDFB2D
MSEAAPLIEARGDVRLPRLALVVEEALTRFLGVLMVLIVVLNVANVVGRYVFSAPVPAADEIMTYVMVWGVFLGGAVVTLRGSHLTMDLVVGLLPAGLRAVAEVASLLTLIGVLGFVAWQSLDYLETLGMVGLTSMSARLPMTWIHAAIPVGFALMMVAAALRLLGRRS